MPRLSLRQLLIRVLQIVSSARVIGNPKALRISRSISVQAMTTNTSHVTQFIRYHGRFGAGSIPQV